MPANTQTSRENVILAAVAATLGVGAAAGYAAWRAVSETHATAAHRWSTFGDAMLFPGVLIVVAVAAMVWLGWKANIG